MKDYIVISYPPKTKPTPNASTYTVAEPVTVKTTRARTPADAAEVVGVRPGGYAVVVEKDKTQRFDRAERAPLVENRPDGNPLDVAVAA